MITSASRFASTVPKNGFSRVAQKEDHLFRRLFPAWPRFRSEDPPHCLPAEIGILVTAAPSCPKAAW
jgi:hypothetical protein